MVLKLWINVWEQKWAEASDIGMCSPSSSESRQLHFLPARTTAVHSGVAISSFGNSIREEKNMWYHYGSSFFC